MRMIALALFVPLLAMTAPAAAQGDVTRISYEAGPCFGTCPVYRVTIQADGSGTFEGRRFTAATGERRFTITRALFQAIARQLQPFRPARGTIRYADRDLCGAMMTDMPSVEVQWTARRGGGQGLYYYYGCDPRRYRAMAEQLRGLPSLLPIGDFIGHGR